MFLRKYASLAILLGPILDPYIIGTTPLSSLFLFFSAFILLIFRNGKFDIPKNYLPFAIYSFTIPVFVAIFLGYINHLTSSFASTFFFSICFVLLSSCIDYQYVKKYYKYLVLFCCAIFISQELMYYSLGYRFSGLIPFFKIKYNYTDMSSFILHQMNWKRSSSIFLEPAHFAQYLLPYLAIEIGHLYDSKKLASKMSIFISVILLLTWSGNAIVVASLLWLIYLIVLKMNVLKKITILIPLVIVFSFSFFNYISNTEKGISLLNRTKELKIDPENISSGSIRIYRGYFVYKDIPTIAKVFGVGAGGVADAIDHTPAKLMFFDYERYLNNIQTLLIGYGIIGTLLFFIFLLYLFRKNSFSGKMILLVFFTLSFMESFFNTSKMIMMLGLAFMFLKYVKKSLTLESQL